jgi:hypothetical protein
MREQVRCVPRGIHEFLRAFSTRKDSEELKKYLKSNINLAGTGFSKKTAISVMSIG